MLESFSFSSPSISKYLTGNLALVKKYNGLNVPADYFEPAMVRLRNDFLNIPLDAVLHPISDTVRELVKADQTAANSAKMVERRELREQLSFEKDRPLLEENESLLYEGPASHGTGGTKIGGRLYLTNQRLIFKSNIFNLKASEWHVFLQDVLDVTPTNALGFVPNELSVKTKSSLDKFIVFERNKWLKLIQDARRQ